MTPITDIDFTDDEIVLTQSDRSNFDVAPDGRPVIFDAATIQVLPKTLADYTLLRTTAFAKDVSAHVFNPDEKDALLASTSFASLGEVRKDLFIGDDGLGKFDLACFFRSVLIPWLPFFP